ncbi:hypothetical protein JKP88DRAFT_298984 [Tribonema minus]|uniref:Uncharacterized protein n=1 Tax=Tribonema minus TaxID=303371 RepID=A0A835ZDU0_9STRA|nr:hypothetical protein JKP88DRAFT_298984 [Tribonema minus]
MEGCDAGAWHSAGACTVQLAQPPLPQRTHVTDGACVGGSVRRRRNTAHARSGAERTCCPPAHAAHLPAVRPRLAPRRCAAASVLAERARGGGGVLRTAPDTDLQQRARMRIYIPRDDARARACDIHRAPRASRPPRRRRRPQRALAAAARIVSTVSSAALFAVVASADAQRDRHLSERAQPSARRTARAERAARGFARTIAQHDRCAAAPHRPVAARHASGTRTAPPDCSATCITTALIVACRAAVVAPGATLRTGTHRDSADCAAACLRQAAARCAPSVPVVVLRVGRAHHGVHAVSHARERVLRRRA